MAEDLGAILNLRDDNPYSIGTVLQLDETTYFLERKPLEYIKSPKDRYYTVIDSDTIWSIANEAYGNSKLYWIIADVNGIDMPIDIASGDTLIIPDLIELRAKQELI